MNKERLQKIADHLKMNNRIFINFSNIKFKCPHCEHEHEDVNDKYFNRINKSHKAWQQGWTGLICKGCRRRFAMCYDMTGSAVGFKCPKYERPIGEYE